MARASEPAIKSYASLTVDDLRRVRVWVNCHTADEEQPWHDRVGEDDYRPHTGDRPAPPYEDLFVIEAVATLADRSRMPAMIDLVPVGAGGQLADSVWATLWTPSGLRVDLRPSPDGVIGRRRFAHFADLDRDDSAVFPVRVEATDAGYPTVTVDSWFNHQIDAP